MNYKNTCSQKKKKKKKNKEENKTETKEARSLKVY